jgi:mannose-6-phosphate isomerase
MVLVASRHFVIERIDLPANSNWALDADQETWILAIEGRARIGSTSISIGDAVFIESDNAGIEVGPEGMSGLMAYPGPDPGVALLRDSGTRVTEFAGTSAHSPKSNEIVEAQT